MVHALDAIEQLLQSEDPDAEALAASHQAFEAALATANRGEGWTDITSRAHNLSDRLNTAVLALSKKREAIRQELGLQAQGARALRGYKPF